MHEFSTYPGVPEVKEEVTLRSNLPFRYTLCNPEIGFAQGSLKYPTHSTGLLHYTEVDGDIRTVYLFGATNLYNINLPLQLHLIFVKHHMKEGWYFADGAILSIDAWASRYRVSSWQSILQPWP